MIQILDMCIHVYLPIYNVYFGRKKNGNSEYLSNNTGE